MLMRKVFPMVLLLFSCSCLEQLTPPDPVIPDKEFKEYVFLGNYSYQEDKEEEDYSPNSFKPFQYTLEYYCYKEQNKEPIYDKDIRLRIYDKKGDIMAEDFLRSRDVRPGEFFFIPVVFYLPYSNNMSEGEELRLVRITEDKEEILYTEECCSTHEGIVEAASNYAFREKNNLVFITGGGWSYVPELECYVSPGIR